MLARGEGSIVAISSELAPWCATPEDIAGAVAFLAGPGGSAMIGQILQPNGGVTRTRA
jgi:NAD(P)-dependent dehydrogenase (short-subunit alcohol dehydrogenase family)